MPAAYGYMPQQQQQQVQLPVKGDQRHKQSSERSNNNRISEEEDKQARIMSSYNSDGFNSIGTAATTGYADPYSNNPSTTISSIVHSPAVAVQDLPTTLPPLNRPMMSNKPDGPRPDPRTGMPYDIREQTPTLRENGPPVTHPHAQHPQHPQHPHPHHQPHPHHPQHPQHPQHPHHHQQQAVAAQAAAELVVGELSPYGCDVPGCYASFPVSSGLFYHMKTAHPTLDGVEKPYRCAMPNCTKRYKNINGLQYHLREAKGTSGHPALTAAANAAASANGEGVGPGLGGAGTVIDERLAKSFKCHAAGCKKAYRTQNGLRYHQSHVHSIPPTTDLRPPPLPPHPPRDIWQ
ncbi:hypothetical protein BDA99DRAFT_491709 [Phascolomyces articulosus]|uniref:C2H2-type domain-containing protein n=1 Tax=Phascolomyces articulosus TaxID=60185 RepID=A0AAD5PJL3_9FUNG|nr:hypothetical protein BDA99DRAFT_491709 [Phascolomyces articulosus]